MKRVNLNCNQPGQLLLPGFQETARQPESGMMRQGNDHLFLAILPDADIAFRISDLARQESAKHQLRGRHIATNRLHMTLFSLGHYLGVPEGIVAVANAASQATAELTSPFEVELHRVGSFSGKVGNHPFVLRDQGQNTRLLAFHSRLGRTLGCGSTSGFTPHVTLLYDQRLIAEEEVSPVRWTVHEFVLIHSFVGQSRYQTLGSWTLHGQN